MSPCASWTDHCLWGLGDQSVCCDDSYHYPELYNFNQVDTENRQCCFIGIWNQSGSVCTGIDIFNEQANGRYCGFGCDKCDDELGEGALEQYEIIDGRRWLMPSSLPGQRAWDARGMIHDLRSNEYAPIPGRIVYERGTCFDNDGIECFGADACACFGANTIDPVVTHDDNCGGVGVGNALPGLLPDDFFRSGYHWPPLSLGAGVQRNTQGNEQWYCRKFGDTRMPVDEGGHNRSMVVVDPTDTGGLSGVTEPMMDPALLSSNVCQSDRLAHCTGVLAKGSPCELFSAYGVCVAACPEPTPECEEQCARTYYSNAHNQFDYLDISRNNTTHIVSQEDDTSMLGRSTAAWKNAILAMVRTHAFPLTPEEGGAERTIRFDRLDHLAATIGNSGIGLFQREWIGTLDTLVKVPDASGTGRLRQAGCVFEYSTWITRVRIVCRLILQQHRDIAFGSLVGHINPLVRLHIIATTTMTVSNLHRPTERGVDIGCGFVSAVDGEHVGLEVRNEWTGNEYANVLYGGRVRPSPDPRALREITTGPPGYEESFMFFDADGRQFIPSRFVEWRGFLGGHSNPTSEEQGTRMPDAFTATCEEIAHRFVARVPGWPTNVDTPAGPDGDDPAGTYGGHIIVEFV